MNVLRIVVDEIPEYGCDDCQIRKPSISISGYDIFMCSAVDEDVTEHTQNATRPARCPLVVEVPEVCEWIREKTERGYAAFYIPKDHEQHPDCYTQDAGEYKFCPNCGKPIKYMEEE